MKKILRRSVCLLLAVVMLLSLVPMALAEQTVTSMQSEDEQWAKIQSLISQFASKNTWKNASYSGALTNKLPQTAILGNGDIGVTSNGSANRKSYHLSSTAFWTDNSQTFGYSGRSPQIVTGGGLSVFAYDPESGKTLDPADKTFLEELDIARAEIRTSQYMGNAKVKMVNWLSQEKNIMVTEITSESEADQTMRALTWGSSLHKELLPTHAGTGTLTNGQKFVWATRTSNTQPNNGTAARWMSEFAMASTVIGDDNAVYSAGTDGSIVFNLPAGKTVYVVTAIECVGNQAVDAATDANGAALANAKSLLSTVKTESEISALRQAQLDWWKNYYLLSWMDLGDVDLNRLYYGNQYIFGCCTREGKQAPGLYGVWITQDNAAWQGDYHLNYNFQSPYYGSYSSNRMLTFSEPMFHTFLDYIDSGIKRASNPAHLKALTGSTGWYYSTRQDEDAFKNGFTDALLLPVGLKMYVNDDGGASYLNQTIDALFCAIQICTYYNYTLDYEWLTTKQLTATGSYYSPYDFIAKTANFYVQWVEKRGVRTDDVFVKDSPATSTNQKLPTDYSANYYKYPAYTEDMGDNYVYVLFDGAHEGSYEFNPGVILGNVQYLTDTLAELGESTAQKCSYAERFAQWKDLSEHLVNPNVSAYTHSSGLRIFGLSEDRGIRTISATVELEWIHPGYQLGFNSNPEDLETARNTVTVMGDKVSPGYGSVNNTPKIFTQAARVGYDAKTLIARLKTYCVNKMAANNWINDNTHGWEKAGVLEALNTMMCMSDGGIIKTFPTWTGADAEFHIIRMPGAFLVSAELSGGKTQYIEVTSEKGGELNLVIPRDTACYECQLVDTTTGETVRYTTAVTENSKDPYLTVSTEAGHTYRLTSGQPVTGTPKVPVDLTAAAVSKTEISASWKKNPEEGDSVTYRVSVTDTEGSTTSYDTDGLTLSLTGLTPGTKYTIRVQALYTPERASEWTDAVTVLLAPENTEKPVLLEVTAPEAVNAALGTTAEALSALLPGTVTTQVYDNAEGYVTREIPVVWDLSTYDPDSTARQTFPGTLQLGDTYSNLFDLTVQITARLQNNTISVTEKRENLNDLLNLTELGTADWMQVYAQGGTALGYYRKNNNAGLISDVTYVNNNNCTDPWAGASDFAIRTSWTDGTPTLEKTDAVATNKIGTGKSAGARYEDNYVEFTVKAQPFEQTLTLSLGAWQSKSTLEMWFSKSPDSKTTASVDSKTDKIGGGLVTAHYNNKGAKLFTVTFSASDPDEELVIRYGVTSNYDSAKKGQAVIQAFALSGTPVLAVADTENGTLTVSNNVPNTGDKVDVTVTPDAHYVLRKGTLKQNEAEITKTEDGYSFTMPYAMVTVSAEFASVATLESLMQQADQRLTGDEVLPENVKKALNDALAAAQAILDAGCASDEEIAAAKAALKVAIEMPNTTSVTGVTLDKTELTLTEGENAFLTATVTPDDATEKSVTWTSNNDGIASVDKNGSVTAVKAGTAAITVTTADGGFTAECTVTVKARQSEHDPILPVIPSLPGLTRTFPFRDVAKTAWYYHEVKGAWEKNLIDGVTLYEFRPDTALTVAQAIKLSAALHQTNETGKVTLKNGAGAWYSTYAAYAVDNGIIEASYLDYTDAQMNAAVSRAEFVHIFYGAMRDYAALNIVADNAIPDVKTTDRFADEIYTFYRAGILTGSDAKGTFHAESNIKRSEVAAILYRMFEPSARKTIKLP